MDIEITEEMRSKLYVVEDIFDKKNCDVFFFKSWSGYDHPVTLKNAINYPEALQRKAYYEATFCKDGAGKQRFVFLKKILLEKKIIELLPDSHVANKPHGEYYFYAEMDNERIKPGDEIKLEDTFALNEYINLSIGEHPLFEEDPRYSHPELIKKKMNYSYEYTYNLEGVLIKTKIINSEGKVSILNKK